LRPLSALAGVGRDRGLVAVPFRDPVGGRGDEPEAVVGVRSDRGEDAGPGHEIGAPVEDAIEGLLLAGEGLLFSLGGGLGQLLGGVVVRANGRERSEPKMRFPI